jgi:hypothetical protein
MANICENAVAVVGLKEPPEVFVKELSKVMFDIDLDNMDLARWGHYKCEGGKLFSTYHVIDLETNEEKVLRTEARSENLDTSILEDGKCYRFVRKHNPETGKLVERVEEIDGKTWYKKIVAEKYPPLGVLVPHTPFVKSGVSVPRFYVDTKWRPAYEEVKKASEAFPDLLFHVHYWIEQDGPTGEFVLRGGKLLEQTESGASWYLFDELKYPSVSLLPKYMDLTLAQRGAAAIDDAIELVKRVHYVIHSDRFTNSPYHALRDKQKLEETSQTLDSLLIQMEQSAKLLTFENVFLPDMSEESVGPMEQVELMAQLEDL